MCAPARLGDVSLLSPAYLWRTASGLQLVPPGAGGDGDGQCGRQRLDGETSGAEAPHQAREQRSGKRPPSSCLAGFHGPSASPAAANVVKMAGLAQIGSGVLACVEMDTSLPSGSP